MSKARRYPWVNGAGLKARIIAAFITEMSKHRILFRMSDPRRLAFVTNICFFDDETEVVSDNEFRLSSFDQVIWSGS